MQFMENDASVPTEGTNCVFDYAKSVKDKIMGIISFEKFLRERGVVDGKARCTQ